MPSKEQIPLISKLEKDRHLPNKVRERVMHIIPDIMNCVSRNRECILRSGEVDMEKVAKILDIFEIPTAYREDFASLIRNRIDRTY